MVVIVIQTRRYHAFGLARSLPKINLKVYVTSPHRPSVRPSVRYVILAVVDRFRRRSRYAFETRKIRVVVVHDDPCMFNRSFFFFFFFAWISRSNQSTMVSDVFDPTVDVNDAM